MPSTLSKTKADHLLLTCIVCSLEFISTNSVHSQIDKAVFDHISFDQGLPNATVNAVERDHFGYIWLGTLNGLSRYDGYEVKSFKHELGDTTSIAENAIAMHCLLEDRSGALWIGTFNGGLDRFDHKSQRFVHFRHEENDPSSLSHNSVRAVFQDQEGSLWVGTYGGGLNRYIPEKGKFVRYVHDPSNSNSLSDNFVRTICEDQAGTLWVGTKNGGLNRISKDRTRITRYVHDPKKPRSMPAGEIWALYAEEGSNLLFIGTDRGLCIFGLNTETFMLFQNDAKEEYSLANDFVVSICEDNNRTLWIGTYGGGLDRFDKVTRRFHHLRHQASQPGSLSSDLIRTVFADTRDIPMGQQAIVWVGTDGGGVSRLNTERKAFKLYRNTPEDPTSIGRGSVQSFCEDRSRIVWIGTSLGGLNRFDPSTGRFVRFLNDPSDSKTLSHNYVSAILEDHDASLWVGTWGGGLNIFDRRTGRFKHFINRPHDPASLGSNQITAILQDRAGTLWVAAFDNGLDRYDNHSNGFIHYRHDSGNPGSLSHNQTLALLEDRHGTLWVGTQGGGLNRFDRSSGTFIHYRYDPTNPQSLSNDRVYSLYEDPTGTLWAGTANGLNKMVDERGKFDHFFSSSGLVSDYIRGISGDGGDNLWLATPNGLTRFNVRTKTARNYDVYDGLQGNEFSGSTGTTRNGEILFGGPNGFNIFHPDSIIDNQRIPPIALTGFNIFEKPAELERPVGVIQTIVLSYKEDYFSFSFAALDFTNPVKNRYAFKMEGYNQEWVYSGTRRFAYYTNLDPGEYIFRVKGSNNDGIWNEAGTSVALVITPPFWETWWFRLLVLGGVFGILSAAYNYRVARLLEMERMRVRIASDLHDDIGSSLSGIALLTDMVRKNIPHQTREHKQLQDAALAARHTADALKDIVWIINPEHDTLDDIILRMKDAAAKLLIGVDYTFDCDNEKLATTLDIEFRRNVLLIYKEALNNIAKYAHATSVGITIKQEGNLFHLRIVDNGVGFDEATVEKGNGLRNLRARATKIGGTISLTSTPGQGTVIALVARIP